eukprot:GHVU01116046.1.p1 GENE.GHVU01116046.1~~GHVU01116046.1.p1  ORF type:complete len:114 (-),score=11.16 GHVU01116046.1:132-473(-)
MPPQRPMTPFHNAFPRQNPISLHNETARLDEKAGNLVFSLMFLWQCTQRLADGSLGRDALKKFHCCKVEAEDVCDCSLLERKEKAVKGAAASKKLRSLATALFTLHVLGQGRF